MKSGIVPTSMRNICFAERLSIDWTARVVVRFSSWAYRSELAPLKIFRSPKLSTHSDQEVVVCLMPHRGWRQLDDVSMVISRQQRNVNGH